MHETTISFPNFSTLRSSLLEPYQIGAQGLFEQGGLPALMQIVEMNPFAAEYDSDLGKACVEKICNLATSADKQTAEQAVNLLVNKVSHSSNWHIKFDFVENAPLALEPIRNRMIEILSERSHHDVSMVCSMRIQKIMDRDLAQTLYPELVAKLAYKLSHDIDLQGLAIALNGAARKGFLDAQQTSELGKLVSSRSEKFGPKWFLNGLLN